MSRPPGPAEGAPDDGVTDDGADRLEDATHVLHGPGGSGAWRSLLYAVYLMALLGSLYGFTVTRGVVETFWPAWRRSGLVPPVLGGLVVVALGGLLLAHLAGRRRGPVTPPVPWVDLVATTSVDRALVLRDAWRVPGAGLLAAGTLGGAILGAAAWGGDATGPWALVAGTTLGVLLGGGAAVAWLAGQLVSDGSGPASGRTTDAVRLALRPRLALRALGTDVLRTHSARSSRLGGAVLAGDPRALRLEAGSPVRRGRHLALRSRGRLGTVLARDVLGLRRQPLLVVGGAVLAVPAAALVALAVTHPGARLPAALAGAVVAHLAAGTWAEGMRLLGDTLGAPRLLGGSVRAEALAHAVPPVALVVVAGLVAAPLAVVLGGPHEAGAHALAAAVACALLALAVAATQAVGAFRVLPPSLTALPEAGPILLAAWAAWPLLLAALGGGTVLARVAADPAGAVVPVLVVLAVLTWLAARALDRAASAHRS